MSEKMNIAIVEILMLSKSNEEVLSSTRAFQDTAYSINRVGDAIRADKIHGRDLHGLLRRQKPRLRRSFAQYGGSEP